MKNVNKLLLSAIIIPMLLSPIKSFAVETSTSYTVKNGDSLWKIATANKLTVDYLKLLNKLTTNNINIGQVIKLQPEKVIPSITYIVQAGNTASSIGKLFNVPASDIMKYNYMGVNDWFNEGQTIYINGYAPRDYAVTPGMDKSPTQYGKLVDWFRDGQYLLKRNDVFTIVDFATRKQFTVRVLGGFQHCDVETLTSSDTAVMKSLFPTWNWTPRPVVIFKDGMNIAGSLSGMPHSFDTTPNNGVTGHFDLYLKNSLPHSGSTSQTYVQQHYSNILISSGQKK